MQYDNTNSNNVLDIGFDKKKIHSKTKHGLTDDATPYIQVEVFDLNNEVWRGVSFDEVGNAEIRFSEFNSIDLQHQFEDSILTIIVPFEVDGSKGTSLGNFLFNRDFTNEWTNIIIDGNTFECYTKEYKYSTKEKGRLTVKAYAEEWQLNTWTVPTGVKKFKGKAEGTYGYTPKFIMTNKTVHEVLTRLYKDAIFDKLLPPVPKSSLVFEPDTEGQPAGYGGLVLNFEDYDSNDLELNLQNISGIIDHLNKVHSSYHKPYVVTNSEGKKDIVFYGQQEWDKSIVAGIKGIERSIKYNVEFLNNRTTLTGDTRYINEYKKDFVFSPRKIEEVVVEGTLSGEDDGEKENIEEENRKAENYPTFDRMSLEEVSLSDFKNIRLGDKFGEQVIISKKLTYDTGNFKCSIAFDQNDGLDGSGLDVDGTDELDVDYDATWLYYGLDTISPGVTEGAILYPNFEIGTSLENFILQSQYNQLTLDLYKRKADNSDSIGVTHNPSIDFEKVGNIDGTIYVRYRAINEEYGFTSDYPNIGILFKNTSVKTPSGANSHVVASGVDDIFGNYILIKFRKDL